ncbi:MAG: hypothetical protein ACOCZ8_05605 [Bacteroidota bacterium]
MSQNSDQNQTPKYKRLLLILVILISVGGAGKWVYETMNPKAPPPRVDVAKAMEDGVLESPMTHEDNKVSASLDSVSRNRQTTHSRVRVLILQYENMLPPNAMHPDWRKAPPDKPNNTPRADWQAFGRERNEPESIAIGLKELASSIRPDYFNPKWRAAKPQWEQALQRPSYSSVLNALQTLDQHITSNAFITRQSSREAWQTNVKATLTQLKKADKQTENLPG